MRILNLGCGTQVSDDPNVTNIDWTIWLRLRRNPVLRRMAPVIVGSERRERFGELPSNVVVHDLSKGIPYGDGEVDVTYSSHVLEHLDRPVGEDFVGEMYRVLKPGGVLRVVVPDLGALAEEYLAAFRAVGEGDDTERRERYDQSVDDLLEQSVRREAYASRTKRGVRRSVENLILGDARRRGETHQWMYDSYSLARLLRDAGFEQVEATEFDRSVVPDWGSYRLDQSPDGSQYKPGSLYMEARKPASA